MITNQKLFAFILASTAILYGETFASKISIGQEKQPTPSIRTETIDLLSNIRDSSLSLLKFISDDNDISSILQYISQLKEAQKNFTHM